MIGTPGARSIGWAKPNARDRAEFRKFRLYLLATRRAKFPAKFRKFRFRPEFRFHSFTTLEVDLETRKRNSVRKRNSRNLAGNLGRYVAKRYKRNLRNSAQSRAFGLAQPILRAPGVKAMNFEIRWQHQTKNEINILVSYQKFLYDAR